MRRLLALVFLAALPALAQQVYPAKSQPAQTTPSCEADATTCFRYSDANAVRSDLLTRARWKGSWSGATQYYVSDLVSRAGATYIATADNLNSQPPSASWAVVDALASIANMTTDGTDPIHVYRTTPPNAAAAGVTSAVFRPLDLATMPGWPVLVEPHTGLVFSPLMPFQGVGAGRARWGCSLPPALGTSSAALFGQMQSASAAITVGSAFAGLSDTTLSGSIPNSLFRTGTGAGSSAGVRCNADFLSRGNAAGRGGFFAWHGFRVGGGATSTQRLFVGWKDSSGVITANTEPSAVLDSVYVGCDSTTANLNVCSNDNAASATCTDLGGNFPCRTNGALYNAFFWAAANAASIDYALERVDSPFVASGTLSSDLPRNTVNLGCDFWQDNGSAGGASDMYFYGACAIANP